MTRARVLTFANQKGGVGKSSTAEAFIWELGERGYRTLAVDMDAQPGNMSLHLGADKSQPGITELLSARHPDGSLARECIQKTAYFGDLIAADVDLDNLDASLSGKIRREAVLLSALEPVLGDYDFVVIDTPPALQVRTSASIFAADDVIVPSRADLSSVYGTSEILEHVGEIADAFSRPCTVAGVALVDWSGQTALARELAPVTAELAGRYGTKVFDTIVRHAVAVSRAQRALEPLGSAFPTSHAAHDYRWLVDEYLSGIGYSQCAQDRFEDTTQRRGHFQAVNCFE